MDSYTPKRDRMEESDFYQAQEPSPRSHEKMSMGLPTTSNISGTQMEAEPPSNRFQPMTGHGVSRFCAVGRAGLGGTGRVLSKEQIRHFITSTVIPRHRSLTSAKSRVNERYSRPEDTNSAHKRPEMANHSSSVVSRTNMEVGRQFQTGTVQMALPTNGSTSSMVRGMTNRNFSTNNETRHKSPKNFEEELSRQRPVAKVSPQPHNILQNTPRETMAAPQAMPVPQRVVGFTSASQETRREARTVPREIPETNNSVQLMPGQTIRVSREGSEIMGLQQETQEETRVPEIASVLYENKRGVVNGSQGMQCSASFHHRTNLSTVDVSVHCQHNVLSKNDEEIDEIVDDDVEEFLQQFSLDKLNISSREPANTRMPVDLSPWDPEYTLIPVDRYSCRELIGSERFVPCQDCFIDLKLFL